MTEPTLEEIRRILDAPVAPREAFARSLLERLESVLAGEAVSADEIDAQSAEELPMREAMSVICPDPVGVDPVLGDVGSGSLPEPPTTVPPDHQLA